MVFMKFIFILFGHSQGTLFYSRGTSPVWLHLGAATTFNVSHIANTVLYVILKTKRPSTLTGRNVRLSILLISSCLANRTPGGVWPFWEFTNVSRSEYRIGGQIETIWKIPVILLRNYGGGSIILPPDNAVWLYALPFIYLSCVDSVAELNRTTQKNINHDCSCPLHHSICLPYSTLKR